MSQSARNSTSRGATSQSGLFVRIPKTASTSIESILTPYMHVRLNSRDNLLPPQNAVRRWSQEGLARLWIAALGPDIWRDHFCFSFVRCPYDRAVSSWQHVRRMHLQGKPITAQPLDATADLDFETYLRLVAEHSLVGQAEWHSTAQAVHLVDVRGQIAVDTIGRFENLEQDFNRILRRLGIPPTQLPHHKRSHDRGTTDSHYTPATRALVQQIYAEDFERLGYSSRQNR